MSEFQESLFHEDFERAYPESDFSYEPEDPEEVLRFVHSLFQELIERTIPESKRVLTLEKAAKCLSLLGKIWNMTACPEGCEIDSLKCPTSDERLLDMEGYVEEYQYLHLGATDMALTDIRIIPKHFIWLLSVDVSGNRLTNITACPLTKLPNVVKILLNRNRIFDPYLAPMKHLQYLGLNTNKIESVHRIYHPNLQTLDLNWNVITGIDSSDCWKLKNLRHLELRGNRLTTIKGIEYQNLVALYLAENKISQLQGLQNLPNLKKLHLRNNPLSDLSGFTSANARLKYLNLRSCQISDIQELEKLKVLKALTVLVVKGNLFNPEGGNEETEQEEEEEQQRNIRILRLFPELKRINKRLVTREDLHKAKEMQEQEFE